MREMLQYGKLYQSLKKVSAEWHAGHVQWEFYWDYIMFFGNGTLLSSSIASSMVEKILSGFASRNKNLTQGNFVVTKNEIEITIDKNVFKGIISDHRIIVQGQTNNGWDLFTVIKN